MNKEERKIWREVLLKSLKYTAIISAVLVAYMAGYGAGYNLRDSQIESAIIRHWIEEAETNGN